MYLEQIHFHNRPTFHPTNEKGSERRKKTRHHRNPSDRKWVTQKKENPTKKNVNFSYASRPPVRPPTTENSFSFSSCAFIFHDFLFSPALTGAEKGRGRRRGSREENYGKFSFNLDVFFSVCTLAEERGRRTSFAMLLRERAFSFNIEFNGNEPRRSGSHSALPMPFDFLPELVLQMCHMLGFCS